MWPIDALHDPAWRPLTYALLHFLWQGLAVAIVWTALFRLLRSCTTQLRYALGLAGMFVMLGCPVATFVWLQTGASPHDAAFHGTGMAATASHVNGSPAIRGNGVLPRPKNVATNACDSAVGRSVFGSDVTTWIVGAQPYLLAGWIVGLVFFSGRLMLGVVGAHRMGRGRLALSGEIADRAATLAARLGFRSVPRLFSATAVREAVVVGLLRPMVLVPVAWLAEMPLDVLEAVIAHELAHIRRHDVWFNLFQRFVETLLFYHPAVWWLSRRVRLAREMCCDEMAARATGERVVYATALEFAARRRLEPAKKSLLEVALGITRMTLLDRVRNVLGLAARHEQGRWWPAAVMTLLVLPALWFASMATTLAQEEKSAKKPAEVIHPDTDPNWEQKASHNGRFDWKRVPKDAIATSVNKGKNTDESRDTAVAFFMINMEQSPAADGAAAQMDRDRFEIYKATQAEILRSRMLLRVAMKNPKVAKLPRRAKISDPENWLASRLQVTFPNKSQVMRVFLRTDGVMDATVVLNAIVDAYMTDVVVAEQEKKQKRFDDLDRIRNEKEQELRNSREEFRGLANAMGGANPETRRLRQKMAMDEVALLQNAMAKSTVETNRQKVELAVQEASLEDAKGDARPPILKEIKRIRVSIRVTEAQNADMAKKIKNLLDEVLRFDTESVDMQMVRSRIKDLETSLSKLAAEMDRLRFELRTPPRVTLMERAE